MTKALGNAVTFLIVALGAVVASRALGAEDAGGLAQSTDALKAIAENPTLLAFLSFFGIETVRRLWPTRGKASNFFLLGRIFRFLAAFFTVAATTCDQMGQHPFAQRQRRPCSPPARSDHHRRERRGEGACRVKYVDKLLAAARTIALHWRGAVSAVAAATVALVSPPPHRGAPHRKN
jgi:hypothetical protein